MNFKNKHGNQKVTGSLDRFAEKKKGAKGFEKFFLEARHPILQTRLAARERDEKRKTADIGNAGILGKPTTNTKLNWLAYVTAMGLILFDDLLFIANNGIKAIGTENLMQYALEIVAASGLAAYVHKKSAKNANNEKTMNLIVENINDYVLTVDSEFRYTYASPSFYRLTGYGTDIIGTDSLHNIDKTEIDAIMEKAKKSMLDGKPCSFESTTTTKNGDKKIIEFTYVPLAQLGVFKGAVIYGKDMTQIAKERKSAKGMEARFTEIFRNSPIAMEIYNADGKLEDVNAKCLEIFGVKSVDAVRGFDLFADPNITKEMKEMLQSGMPISYECEFDFEKVIEANLYETSRSGKIYLIMNVAPVNLANDGALLGYSAQIVDITERKIAETALKSNIKNLDMIISNSPNAINLAKLDGSSNIMNPAFEKLMGMPAEEIINHKPYDFVHPEDMEIVKRFNADMRAHPGETKMADFRIIRKDGKIIEVEATGNIIKENGGQGAYLVIMSDVTEKNTLEREIKVSEQRWNFALEGSGNGVWDWNVQTNEVFFSKHWKSMLGYSEGEIKNDLSEWASRIHPDDYQRTADTVNAHINGKTEIYESEHRVRTKNGTYKWIFDRGKVMERSPDGKALRLVGTHSDIDTRKKMSQTLESQAADLEIQAVGLEEQKNRLQELNAQKDKFFSIIAHDLRNPFNGMIGMTTILFDEFETLPPADIKKGIELLKNAVKDSHLLIEDLLTWSKVNSGRMEFKPVTAQIKPLIENKRKLLLLTAAKKSITVSNLVPDGLEGNMDEKMTAQIIQNLLTNAIKFTQHEGRIEISARQNDDNFIQITVKDNGRGIAKGNMEKLFRIDMNFTTRGTDDEEGTGLGLSIVMGMVEKQGGKVWVESEEDIGTLFHFTVPTAIIEQGFENLPNSHAE